jgi:hypothetical protein
MDVDDDLDHRQGGSVSARRDRDDRRTEGAVAGSDFGKLIVDETEKWGKVIRAANIKPE